MKLFYTLICGLVINFTYGQFSDDFGNGSTYPSLWEGQTNEFWIQSEELRLNASTSGSSLIYLPPVFFNYSPMEIRLKVRLSFSPSGNNRLKLFIFSDSANPLNASNSYYLQLGESGSNDAIALHGIFSGNDVELIRGLSGRIASSFQLELKITKEDSLINIDLWNDTLNDYQTEISYIDTSNFDLNALGLDCKYTSSNSTKFYFDEVYVGPIVYDTLPPEITSLTILDSNSIQIQFSEEIDTSNYDFLSINLSNPTIQNPNLSSYSNGLLTIDFPTAFINNQTAILDLGTVLDYAGNTVQVDTSLLILFGEIPEVFDLLINEIMSDPTPSQGLPICEYVEIQNVSNKIINCQSLFIADLSDTIQLDSNLFLFPNEFLLLTDFSCVDSFSIGKTIAINLPTLNNSNDRIAILNAGFTLIDSVRYYNSWHQSNKEDGGFSLEKAETNHSCGNDNWFSSEDPNGGTPGYSNSIFASILNVSFELISFEQVDTNSIRLMFNKFLEPYFKIENISSNSTLNSINLTESSLTLHFFSSLIPGDEIQLSIIDLNDCFGNNLDTIFYLTIPFLADSTNLLINEILFNPETGGSDFVEIYNNSDKPINLQNCQLGNYMDTISNLKVIIEEQFILKPHEYRVITKDTSWLQNVFNTDKSQHFIQISSLPSYPNDFGEVYLINAQNQLIDHLSYDVNMHYPLLTDFENKSLERISFNLATNDKNNWNTASGNDNYATPGYENSQAITTNPEIDFEITPEYFTPNNDGDKDNISISLEIEQAGIYNLTIYNLEGQAIKQLINSEYLSSEKTVIWNGKNKNNHLATSGIYIFHLTFISEEGTKNSKRKTAYLKR